MLIKIITLRTKSAFSKVRLIIAAVENLQSTLSKQQYYLEKFDNR